MYIKWPIVQLMNVSLMNVLFVCLNRYAKEKGVRLVNGRVKIICRGAFVNSVQQNYIIRHHDINGVLSVHSE